MREFVLQLKGDSIPIYGQNWDEAEEIARRLLEKAGVLGGLLYELDKSGRTTGKLLFERRLVRTQERN